MTDDEKKEFVQAISAPVYRNPQGTEVDPVDYAYDIWSKNHLSFMWYELMGYFILSNAMNYFEDLNDQELYPRIPYAEAKGVCMHGHWIGNIDVTYMFARSYWTCKDGLMNEVLHKALLKVLGSKRLVEGTLRLTLTPNETEGKSLGVKLAWLESVA